MPVLLLENAEKVIIVPGYGMVVGPCQHAVSELTSLLEEHGVTVKFAIHPVSRRIAGNMNRGTGGRRYQV